MKIKKNEKGQAMAGDSHFFKAEAFGKINHTEIRWLGGAGIMINSRGSHLMIDPVLEGFDMPLLFKMPILIKDVPMLDGILITHIDNDHYSQLTCQKLKEKCKNYYAPKYVAGVMSESGLNGMGYNIHDTFSINDIKITLTPAEHNWQNGSQKYQFREWKLEDYCGYWIECIDGTIWLPGDSRLIPEHLQMPNPDVILFDFADNEWHITLDGAITLANTYPEAQLICIHWGSVDAPNMTPFNGNPENLLNKVVNPERIRVLAPGEPFILK